MKMFTALIHVSVLAKMSLIYVLNDVSTIPLSIANHVVKQFVVHGLSGHHGLHVQKHVEVENDPVREPLHGMMRPLSFKFKQRIVIQVTFRHRSRPKVFTEITENGR